MQDYRHYQIRKKVTAVSHRYGDSSNHAHDSDAQVMTADTLQALVNVTMEGKEAMENLKRINLTLSHILTQAQETILVLFKHLQALQGQTNAKKLATEKPDTDNKIRGNKSKRYFWTHRSTHILDHTSPTCRYPNK